MKFKIKLYFLSICLTCLTAFAQNNTPKKYTKKISEPFDSDKNSSALYNKLGGRCFVFSNGKEILSCNFYDDVIMVKKIDSEKLTLIKENRFEKFFAKNYFLVKCIKLNNRYFVFYSSWDGDAKKEQVFSAEIDFDKCEFVGTPKLLLQVDGKVSGNNSDFFYFNLTESSNEKSIAVNYIKAPENKKSSQIVGVKVFDENLNQTSASEVVLPYNENKVDCSSFRLDNNGDFYWVAKVFHDDSRKDKKNKKDLVANFHYEICGIKFEGKTINTIKIEDNNNVVNELSLFVTPKNLLVCGGTYSNGSSDVMDTNGYVGFKISPEGKIYDKVFSEFTLDVLKKYRSEKEQKNIDKTQTKGESNGLYKVFLKDVYICENGDFVFIGEQKYTFEPTNSRNIDFYMDLIVSKVKTNGSLVWLNKIPKKEVDVKSSWYVNSNNNYYFIFVDDMHNINLPLDKNPDAAFGGHDEYMSVVKISDSDGSVNGGEIFNNMDFKNYDIKKYMLKRNYPFKISENEIVFEINQTNNSSGDVIVKVNLD
ncbi:MAG: hypothetical protein REI96_04815 [Flavobacterium nitrogenifigens]|uniref:hypothetical protein n=1 Tax=Flavobacterium nitrogenifigens TaxID=1617283 RepID=UPI002806AC02|nr:hypothetical protein [Flavobacterium nitrogenifigens]MDQ8011746.1 hypothetical protein [Flavobacterium nitrogenifigens]